MEVIQKIDIFATSFNHDRRKRISNGDSNRCHLKSKSVYESYEKPRERSPKAPLPNLCPKKVSKRHILLTPSAGVRTASRVARDYHCGYQ